MTKSAHIMTLHAQGLATRQIACEVYQIPSEAPNKVMASAMAYVRIVTKQRRGRGLSPADVAWRSANADGTSATEVTAGTMIGTTVTNVTTTVAQSSSASTQVGAFSLANEYLFWQLAWETV